MKASLKKCLQRYGSITLRRRVEAERGVEMGTEETEVASTGPEGVYCFKGSAESANTKKHR